MKPTVAFLCLAAAAAAEQLPLRTYTTAEGLAHNHINAIRQDSRGFLWFCTDEGLSRFDGYQFTNYTTRHGLPHPRVNDLLEARDGAYWVASDGGTSRFNPQAAANGEPMFVTWAPDQYPEARRVNALAEDGSSAIWCATYNGLYRLDRVGGGVKFRGAAIGLPDEDYEGRLVNNIALDSRDVLWLAARTGLYRHWKDGHAERYTLGLPDKYIETVVQDRKGRWWIGTRTRGFCLLVAEPDPARPVTERCYSTADGLPADDVRSIFETSDGTMWIGTAGGLSEFTPGAERGQLFRNYTSANGLSQIQVHRLAEDGDGNLWIGTRSGGVMRLERPGFVSYREADGFLPGLHHGIFETTRGELCVLTSTGPHRYVQRLAQNRFTATELRLPSSFALEGGLQDLTGEWWFATGGGLARFSSKASVEDLGRLRPKAIYTKARGLASDYIHQLAPDAKGGLWITTISGGSTGELRLNRWDGFMKTLSRYAETNGISLAQGDLATAFAEDRSGNFWIGFRDRGALLRYGSGRFQPVPAPAGTIPGRVNALYVDHGGRLWIGSSQAGLLRVDDPGSAHPQIIRYTAGEGLSSNEILCLTEDQWGRIYAGTNRGVDRLDAKRGSFRRYTTDDGLPGGSVWEAYRDQRGVLWFATDRGIARLIPAPDPVPYTPPILITRIWVMGVPQPVSELGETSVEKLELAPGQNHVRIEFARLDFRPGGAVRYQYKLEGADRDWSAPTGERAVLYAHLASGTYRFLVRAVNSDGMASVRPAAAAFTILPPLWQRAWFLALALLAASGMAWTAHRFHVRRLLEVERLRTRIATDLHDDIGSSLSQIAVLTEVIRRAGPDEPVTAPLTTVGNLSRDLLSSMNDIVWAINPKRDYLADLTSRMRRFAADALTPRGIDFRFTAPDGQDDTRLGGDLRREVFLIFKESVNNIVRHSHCSQAAVQFLIQGAYVRLTVSDNGKGFDPTRLEHGNGLANMRLRAARLGGTIDIAAGDGLGVTVTLTVPLARGRRITLPTYSCR